MPADAFAAAHRRRVTSNAVGIGLATGAYGLSFGAISVASGLDAWQTQSLSLLMFTGGSQFALVGVLGAGGGAVAAVLTAWLLGARNSMYALSMAPTLQVTGLRRLAAAELTIDESTAMALAHPEPVRRPHGTPSGAPGCPCTSCGTSAPWSAHWVPPPSATRPPWASTRRSPPPSSRCCGRVWSIARCGPSPLPVPSSP